MKCILRCGRADVTSGLQHLRVIKKKRKSLHGSVPALQADSHRIHIHGSMTPPFIFYLCWPDVAHMPLNLMFYSAKLLLFGPLTESTWNPG